MEDIVVMGSIPKNELDILNAKELRENCSNLSVTIMNGDIKKEVEIQKGIENYNNAILFYGIKTNHNRRESTNIKQVLQKKYFKIITSKTKYKDNAYLKMKQNKLI